MNSPIEVKDDNISNSNEKSSKDDSNVNILPRSLFAEKRRKSNKIVHQNEGSTIFGNGVTFSVDRCDESNVFTKRKDN